MINLIVIIFVLIYFYLIKFLKWISVLERINFWVKLNKNLLLINLILLEN